MNTKLNVLARSIAALCLTAAAALAVGCERNVNLFGTYNENGYSVGAGEAEGISKIDIEWTVGDVNVVFSESATKVKFEEATSEKEPSLLLHARVRNGELDLKYAGSGARFQTNFSKNLTVSVPAGTLAELSVEHVSGQITVDGGAVRDLSVETVAGDLTVRGCAFSELDFDSVSGNAEVYLTGENGFRCEFESLSGKFYDEFGAASGRDGYLYGAGGALIEADTVSGNLSLLRENGGDREDPPGGAETPDRPGQSVRYERYDDADSYLSGSGSAANVAEVEIDWLGGEVIVLSSPTADAIAFSEEAAGDPLYYRLRGGKLDIRFAASGAELSATQKTLRVIVPQTLSLSDLEIEGEGCAVTVSNVRARDLSVKTVSGDIAVSGCELVDGDFETASGDISFTPTADRGFTLQFRSLTGTLDDGLGMTAQRDRWVYGNGRDAEISVETVTGDLTVRKSGAGDPSDGEQGGTGGPSGGAGTRRYRLYDDAALYTEGGGSAAGISKIEIDWLGGEIAVVLSPSATEVTFSETGGSERMYHLVRRGELSIEFAASGAAIVGAPKQLTVTVPSSLWLSEVEIEATDCDVRIEGLSTRSLSVETTSGNITADADFVDGDFETVGGSVQLFLPDRGFLLEYTTRSGTFYDEFSTVVQGDRRVYGNGWGSEISVETLTGGLSLCKKEADR